MSDLVKEEDTFFGSLVGDVWRLLFTEFACVIEARIFMWVSRQCHRLTWTHLKNVPLFQEALDDDQIFKSDKQLAEWYGRCGKDRNLGSFGRLCSKVFKDQRKGQRKQLVETAGIFRGAVMAWNEALLYPLPTWHADALHSKKNLNNMNLSPANRHFLTNEKNPIGRFLFLDRSITLHANAVCRALATCQTVTHLRSLLPMLDPSFSPELVSLLFRRDVAFWEDLLANAPEITNVLEDLLLGNGAIGTQKSSFENLVREPECCHLLPLLTQFLVQKPEFMEDGKKHNKLLWFFGSDAHGQLFRSRVHVDAFFTALVLVHGFPRPVVYLERMSHYPEEVVDYFMERFTDIPNEIALTFDLNLLFKSWTRGNISSVRWITYFASLAKKGNLQLQVICGVSAQFLANIPSQLVPEYAAAMDSISLPKMTMNFAGFGQVLTFLTSYPHHLAYLYTVYKRQIPIFWTIGSNVHGRSYTIEFGPYLSEHGPTNVEAIKRQIRHMARLYEEVVLDPFPVV
jgi:hypothetical protein